MRRGGGGGGGIPSEARKLHAADIIIEAACCVCLGASNLHYKSVVKKGRTIRA